MAPQCGSSVFSSTAVSAVHVVSGYDGSSVCGCSVVRDYTAFASVFSVSRIGDTGAGLLFGYGVFAYLLL